MRQSNPVVIPRNHLVEEALDHATHHHDFEPFHRLVEHLKSPYDTKGVPREMRTPPRPDQIVQHTFCGT